MNLLSASWSMASLAKIGPNSSTASASSSASVAFIPFSNSASQSLILGVLTRLISFLSRTTSPSLEVKPVMTDSSSMISPVRPANIFLKCLAMRRVSSLLPIISSRSSSPTK